MSQTHWKKLHNPNYIGAYALEPGKDLTVRITKVVTENVKGEDGRDESCMVAYLDGGHKPFILNKTNCKTIEKVTGTAFIEQWAGQHITLFAAKVKAFGDTVEALRIRPVKPVVASKPATAPAPKETLTPSHPQWEAVKVALKEKKRTVAQILEKFDMSNDDLFTLQSEAV